MPDSSSSRPARSTRLSAARAMLPPRLTRFTPRREERGRVHHGGRQARDDVERRRDLGSEPPDRVSVVDARHEDAVSSGLDVSRRALDRLGKLVPRSSPEVGVGAGVDHERACRRRGARRRDPRGGFVDLEQRAIHLVLEVRPDDAELRHPCDGSGDILRRRAVARLEVGAHGYRNRRGDPRQVLEHRVAVDRGVRPAEREGDAGAGRGESREADLLQDPGGTRVPGVRQHEAGTVVQGKEVRGGGHGQTLSQAVPVVSVALPGG